MTWRGSDATPRSPPPHRQRVECRHGRSRRGSPRLRPGLRGSRGPDGADLAPGPRRRADRDARPRGRRAGGLAPAPVCSPAGDPPLGTPGPRSAPRGGQLLATGPDRQRVPGLPRRPRRRAVPLRPPRGRVARGDRGRVPVSGERRSAVRGARDLGPRRHGAPPAARRPPEGAHRCPGPSQRGLRGSRQPLPGGPARGQPGRADRVPERRGGGPGPAAARPARVSRARRPPRIPAGGPGPPGAGGGARRSPGAAAHPDLGLGCSHPAGAQRGAARRGSGPGGCSSSSTAPRRMDRRQRRSWACSA